MQNIISFTLVLLFVGYAAYQAEGHKANAEISRYDVLLSVIIEELRAARYCAQEKVGNAQQIKGCDEFLITGRNPEQLKINATSTHTSCSNIQNYRVNAKDTDAKKGNAGGWCVDYSKLKSLDQFVQVSLTNLHVFRGVATQGRQSSQYNQWVIKYRVYYSDDCVTFHTDGKVYSGNWDKDTLVIRLFDKPLVGKCIRINPYKYHDWMSMRFDIIGCKV